MPISLTLMLYLLTCLVLKNITGEYFPKYSSLLNCSPEGEHVHEGHTPSLLATYGRNEQTAAVQLSGGRTRRVIEVDV